MSLPPDCDPARRGSRRSCSTRSSSAASATSTPTKPCSAPACIPSRSGARVGPRKAHDLHGAIQTVLRNAIDAGGTSIRDYRDSRGETG